MPATRCTCPSCGTALKFPSALPAGKRVRCPRCDNIFPVPEEDGPVEERRPAPARPGAKGGPAPGRQRPPAGEREPDGPERPARRRREEDEDEPPSRRYAEESARSGAVARRRRPRDEDYDEEERGYDEEEDERPRRPRGKPRRASLAMRVSALILGLIGAIFCGALGAKWLSDANSPEVKAMRELAVQVAAEAKSREMKATVAQFDRLVTGAYFLLAAAPLGIAGGVLAVLGRVKLGGALMLAAVPVPAILAGPSLMALYFLAVGGLVALLTPSWPPGRGPSTAVMALLTAGGWVAVLVIWVILVISLPKLFPKPGETNSDRTFNAGRPDGMGRDGVAGLSWTPDRTTLFSGGADDTILRRDLPGVS